MDYQQWIDSLKTGDTWQVIVKPWGGNYELRTFKVVKRTKARIHVSKGSTTFTVPYNARGLEVGTQGRGRLMPPANQEEIERMHHANKVLHLASRIGSTAWNKQPLETLQAVAQILGIEEN